MKTFRFLGMALMAILIGVNFIACSDDEEGDTPIKNDDGIITNQKQLMQIKMVDDSETITWDFAYDSKGRLASVNHVEKYDGKTYRHVTDYTWGDNVIIAEEDNNTKTYSLNKKLVRSVRSTGGGDWGNATFTYNSANQLIKVEENDSYNTTESYTWQGEKMTKLTFTETNEHYTDKGVYEYSYSGKTCKGYFPFFAWSDSDDIFYAHPELIGLRSSQLPDKIYSKDENSETIETYTYTFSNDGYVENCTEIHTYKRLDIGETNTSTTVYTFTWE